MISFRCTCGQTLQAQDEYAGQLTRCPACGVELAIPRPAGAIQPALGVVPPAAPAPPPPAAYAPGLPYRPRDDRPRGRPPQETSGKAIASMVLGILSLCLPVVLAIPAVIFGLLGLRDVRREGGRLTGGGFAIAGLVLSAVSTVLALPMYFFLVVPISDEVRDGRARSDSQINLKQISLALHNYHDANRAFPPSV